LVVAGPEKAPLSTRIESWIEEIVQNRRQTPAPPSGAEPLDIRELEGALRARSAPTFPHEEDALRR
jgi:hypothetical protein